MQKKLGKTMSTKRVLMELLAAYNEQAAAIGYARANQWEHGEVAQLQAAQEAIAEVIRNFGFRHGVDYVDEIRDGKTCSTPFFYWRREAVNQ